MTLPEFLSLVLGATVTAPCLAQLQINCFILGSRLNALASPQPSIAPNDTIARCFNRSTTGSQCLFTAANVLTTAGIAVMTDYSTESPEIVPRVVTDSSLDCCSGSQ
ncbi:hypothetical protein C8R44DRAFT_907065 [Mycena epipterygia]|nr:hypothetical protein C8R44DRAFT_907065 [Mycena epipterygia]